MFSKFFKSINSKANHLKTTGNILSSLGGSANRALPIIPSKKYYDIVKHRENLKHMHPDSSIIPPNLHYSDTVYNFHEGKLKPTPKYILEDEEYPLIFDDVENLLIRRYLPENISPPYKTIFYSPGKGFIGREIEFTDNICRYLCHASNCQVIIVPHRLAPEYQWPTAYVDTNAIIDFLLQSHVEFQIDRNYLILSGYSSGGAVSLQAANQLLNNQAFVKRLILFSPFLDLSRTPKGYESIEAEDNIIKEPFMEWLISLFAPEDRNRKDEDVSPFFIENLSKFHGVTFDMIYGGHDRVLGDVKQFSERLKNVNIKVNEHVFEGHNHAFLWESPSLIEPIVKDIYMQIDSELDSDGDNPLKCTPT